MVRIGELGHILVLDHDRLLCLRWIQDIHHINDTVSGKEDLVLMARQLKTKLDRNELERFTIDTLVSGSTNSTS